ncbi:MAG: M15 family metallopeptidase [Eubacteriales bacterium]
MSRIFKIIIIVLAIVALVYAFLFSINFYNGFKYEKIKKTVTKKVEGTNDCAQDAKGNKADLSEAERLKAEQLMIDAENGLFILVNKENSLPHDYEPDDLTLLSHYAKNRSPLGRKLRKEAAQAFEKLADAAQEAGYEIVATTAYRSYDFQNTLYTNYVKQYGEQADTFSAKPGLSEHQTGLAVDVSSPSVNYELLKSYGSTQEGKWLAAHAHEFGYIIRYLEGREDITGYMYEPWHIRYVGKTAATEIKEADITLEEYIKEVIEK